MNPTGLVKLLSVMVKEAEESVRPEAKQKPKPVTPVGAVQRWIFVVWSVFCPK
jgi:hypothetical protein